MLYPVTLVEVSIPRRDFWVFQHLQLLHLHLAKVSIPRRDFWVFQLQLCYVLLHDAHTGFNP
ncbi:hypothetical protein CKA32_005589 [Geitlerinema sp. FC II]|nr:hypothetical protein CKA32_005589 [Geitlerinema sp. FC II]